MQKSIKVINERWAQLQKQGYSAESSRVHTIATSLGLDTTQTRSGNWAIRNTQANRDLLSEGNRWARLTLSVPTISEMKRRAKARGQKDEDYKKMEDRVLELQDRAKDYLYSIMQMDNDKQSDIFYIHYNNLVHGASIEELNDAIDFAESLGFSAYEDTELVTEEGDEELDGWT